MHKTCSFFACFFICCAAAAQQYHFVHYTPKDGLINSRVRKAYQDSKGRMYFITYGGLSVYDGARFRNYTMRNGLLADLVNDVLEVGEDSLLVAVNTCGLNVLVRGQIKQLDIGKDVCPFMNQFLKSNDGNVYATSDQGLYRLNSNSIEKLPAIIPGKEDSAVYLGVIAEYKNLLVFTTNDLRHYLGLYLYDKKTKKVIDFRPELFIYSLKTDDSGVIFVSTNETLAVLDTLALATGKLKLRDPYATYMNKDFRVAGLIDFNRQGELLVFSSGKGITRYLKNGSLMQIVPPEPSSILSRNFFIDRENVLWICHDGNGVYKLSNTNLQSVASPGGDNKSGVRTVIAANPDTTWMVMNNRKWILQTRSGSKVLTISPGFDARLLHVTGSKLYAADRNNLYVTAIPRQNETILHFKKTLTIPDSTAFGSRAVIDPYGNSIIFEMWNIIVIKDGQKIFTYPYSPLDLIEGMHIDRNNLLLVTSRGNGLLIFSLHPEDPGNYLKKETQFVKEFESASPRCMVVDQDELIWIGTRFHGLLGFEHKNGQLKKLYHFQTHNGLTDNFITSLACDGENNIIAGTQTGLDRLTKTSEGYWPENVTKSNNTFAYIGYVWTDAGNNAFGLTNAGAIYRVEPVQEVADITEPDLFIEELKINGQPITKISSPLRLKYFQRNISFSVAAPTFIDEKQVKFSYLLSGSGNNEWSDTTSIADIPLLNLSPGSYSLRVKAIFASTQYLTKEIEFAFVIHPPWWQTPWFRIGMGILLFGLVVTGIRIYYRRKLEKQKMKLEKQQALEKERTRIAADMHDDLGAGLSKIRFLSETVQRNISEEAHQPNLQNIASSSVELVDKFNEIIWAMNEKNNSLDDLLYYIRSYTAKYCAENELNYKITIPEFIPPVMINGEMRRHIFLTVKECLHNVVKHAEAKNVWLDVVLDDFITLTVKDDGKGFELTEMGNAGNGLRSMEQRIRNVNGKLHIVTDPGTLLKITVPLPH